MGHMVNKAIGLGIAGTMIGVGYMMWNNNPKAYKEVERKLKRAANDLSDLVNTVGNNFNQTL